MRPVLPYVGVPGGDAAGRSSMLAIRTGAGEDIRDFICARRLAYWRSSWTVQVRALSLLQNDSSPYEDCSSATAVKNSVIFEYRPEACEL